MSFETVADELYGLPPQDFTSARNERARAARVAGDKALAEQIAGLRKPTVVAWLANQVVRLHGDLIESLLTLGHELREAMAAPSGPELRVLDARQRELVLALLQRSREVAGSSGRAATDQVVQGLTDTFRAALADQRALGELASGRLTDALAPSAFAGMQPDTPAGTARSPARRTSAPADAERDDVAAARLEQARQDVAAAQDRADEARRAVRQARAALERASTRTRVAADLVDQLQAELAEATSLRDSAQQKQDAARSAHDQADTAAAQAEERLQDGLDALAQLSG